MLERDEEGEQRMRKIIKLLQWKEVSSLNSTKGTEKWMNLMTFNVKTALRKAVRPNQKLSREAHF